MHRVQLASCSCGDSASQISPRDRVADVLHRALTDGKARIIDARIDGARSAMNVVQEVHEVAVGGRRVISRRRSTQIPDGNNAIGPVHRCDGRHF